MIQDELQEFRQFLAFTCVVFAVTLGLGTFDTLVVS